MEKQRYEHMVAWRDKKIANLEERIKIYEEIVNMCLALCMASLGDEGRINKRRVKQAMAYRYEVSDDGENYLIKRKEEENG